MLPLLLLMVLLMVAVVAVVLLLQLSEVFAFLLLLLSLVSSSQRRLFSALIRLNSSMRVQRPNLVAEMAEEEEEEQKEEEEDVLVPPLISCLGEMPFFYMKNQSAYYPRPSRVALRLAFRSAPSVRFTATRIWPSRRLWPLVAKLGVPPGVLEVLQALHETVNAKFSVEGVEKAVGSIIGVFTACGRATCPGRFCSTSMLLAP
jgi:hypothetical protein